MGGDFVGFGDALGHAGLDDDRGSLGGRIIRMKTLPQRAPAY